MTYISIETRYTDNPNQKVKHERDFLLKVIMEKQLNIPKFPMHINEFKLHEKKIHELSEQNKLLCMFFENKGGIKYYENCILMHCGRLRKFDTISEALNWKTLT